MNASFLSSMDEEVETAFLGTRSGLMRFQRYTGIEKRLAKYVDNLKKQNFSTKESNKSSALFYISKQ